MTRKAYSTDLSDSEWAILAPLIPPAKFGGHPRTTDMPEVCNAILFTPDQLPNLEAEQVAVLLASDGWSRL